MAEHVCPPWLSFLLTNVFRRMAHSPERILGRFIRPGDTVLDVGCGPGFFAVPMAAMVGDRGVVIAADIDPRMLERVKKRAEGAGVADRILLHLARKDRLGVGRKADFALAFWTAHEVAGPGRVFGEIREALKPGGLFLLVEPKIHVSERCFQEMAAAAEGAGFRLRGGENIRLSRAALFQNP